MLTARISVTVNHAIHIVLGFVARILANFSTSNSLRSPHLSNHAVREASLALLHATSAARTIVELSVDGSAEGAFSVSGGL